MRTIALALFTVVAVTAAGCVATTPYLDSRLGQALARDEVLQTLDPQAARRVAPPQTFEGAAAHAVMERYLKSFQSPPAPANVFAIGIGAAGAVP